MRLVLVAVLAVAGCQSEPCFYNATQVHLRADDQDGGAAMVTLNASASGVSCGCCSGHTSQIVEYAWDLDSDGIVDQEGVMLASVVVPRPSAPVVVTVTVTDSDGTKVSDSATISP